MALIKIFSRKVYPTETEGSYTGPFVHGKRHGNGKYIEENVEYVGEWQHDNIHGKGTIKNTANKMSFTGTFAINRMVYGTYTWPNGDIYVGKFENNEMHGRGTLQWSTGEKYEGEFANGTIHGKGTFTDKKGIVYNIEFCKGKAIKQEQTKM